MLRVEDLHTYYGAIHALKGISLHVDQGEVVCLIGSNGAGKSTLVNTISGLLKPRSGKVSLNDRDITSLEAYKIVELGMSLSPEGREVFPDLTVEQNLRLGGYIVKDAAKIEAGYARCYELFPRLKERRRQQAGTLSGGEQQMLAIGRGLMGNPDLMLLDEPSMGLSPILVEQIFDIIVDINAQGTSILLVEQNAQMALAVADRGYVLETGEIVLTGTGLELLNNPKVQAAYLDGGNGSENREPGTYYF